MYPKSYSVEEVYQLVKERYPQYTNDTIIIKKWKNKPAITFKELIFCILINDNTKQVAKKFNRNPQTFSPIIKNKLKLLNTSKNRFIIYTILSLVELDRCYICKKIYNKEFFDIKNHTCQICKKNYDKKYYLINNEKIKAYKSKYRANKLKRTPKWITNQEFKEIEEFYYNCPEGYHVDHIIPLQGKNVSGFHCLSNLQYLPSKENLRKSNKYIPKLLIKGIDY